MKTETDAYIQWKQEHYDQDVIKIYSSYTCHTPEKYPEYPPPPHPPFATESPLPFGNFSIPPFLEFLVRSIPKKRGGGREGSYYSICSIREKLNSWLLQFPYEEVSSVNSEELCFSELWSISFGEGGTSFSE